MGFCGVMAAGLGIVASLGLVSACGMSFVSIVGNMPFLILGKFYKRVIKRTYWSHS